MRQRLCRLLATCGFLINIGCGEGRVEYGVEGGQWRSYAGDPGSRKYSPLDEIDAQNFSQLRVVWAFAPPMASDLRVIPFPGDEGYRIRVHHFEATPIMVDGVLYASTPHSQVFAIDAATGKPRWKYSPASFGPAMRVGIVHPKHRGVTYWRNGDDERIFIATADSFLIALDARTGRPVESFGRAGRVDLTRGLRASGRVLRYHDTLQNSPVALFENILIVGGTISDFPKTKRQIPGDVRAYDARTGKQLWTFHTVPAEGELGTETWEDEAWRYTGAANVWGMMSVDPELGTVYLPTSTPTSDYYGGHRLGDNLFAETLLCLDARTGRRLWHQQLVRHGLWDYDLSAPPNLVDIEVDGKPIQAVAQVTKQGFAFVFDRVTGEPVWPIEDRPVPASDVPGERSALTQRFPTRPPPFERQGIGENDLIDFTPELRSAALSKFRRFRSGPVFTPPSVVGSIVLPGTAGGANWTGAAFDPESGVLYVPSIARPTLISLRPSPETEFAYTMGLVAPIDTEPGLPLIGPPYAQLSALALTTGELRWQTPIGDGPRNHPKLAALGLPPLGNGVRSCALVTRTLVLVGPASEVGGRWDTVLRAFDKRSGSLVGAIDLPAPGRGCPMTYEAAGKQYIALTIGSEEERPRLIALALP